MDNLQVARSFLSLCCNLSEEAFSLSTDMWKEKNIHKGEVYSKEGRICRTAAFIVNGYFRTYKLDEDGQEKNAFFHSPGQNLVSFVSFVQQVPCDHYIEAITDAKIITISYDELQQLYNASVEWSKVGRLFAEFAYKILEERFMGYYGLSPEQRYLKLLQEAPDIFNVIALKEIASFLGIEFQSLCRIRKRISGRRS